MLNQVSLVGRLTADPQIKTYDSGKKSALFRLAVDRDSAKREADFIPIICWDRTADIVARFCRKGMLVSLIGKLQTSNYTNRDGRTVFGMQVNAQVIHYNFPGNRDVAGEGSQPSYGQSQPRASYGSNNNNYYSQQTEPKRPIEEVMKDFAYSSEADDAEVLPF